MSTTYDRIAPFYDVDMARNMRFDDVAFYAETCAQGIGPVLELGCGNGRILLPLVARGLDVVGVDASEPMLRELMRKRGARARALRLVRADARRLPLAARFATILCPYSLITYMTTDDDRAALLTGARELLAPHGSLVVDAFVPRPVEGHAEFREDYRRAWGACTLVRSKRIHALADACHRIERRYEVLAPDGSVEERIDVAETIRPCSPADLRDALRAQGFLPVREAWDYGASDGPLGAQFFTLVARSASPPR